MRQGHRSEGNVLSVRPRKQPIGLVLELDDATHDMAPGLT